MNTREEEQNSIGQRMAQDESQQSPVKQFLIALVFIGFIVGLPTIIGRLSK
jgi:hypothetical protein